MFLRFEVQNQTIIKEGKSYNKILYLKVRFQTITHYLVICCPSLSKTNKLKVELASFWKQNK